MTTIGERIKGIRKRSGLTQRQLAERMSVSPSMIGQYEAGFRRPKMETLERIARALDVSVQYLIGKESLVNEMNAGFVSFQDIAEEMNIPVSIVERIIRDDTFSDATDKVIRIGLLLAEELKNQKIDEEKEAANLVEDINNAIKALNINGLKAALNWIHEIKKIPDYQNKEYAFVKEWRSEHAEEE